MKGPNSSAPRIVVSENGPYLVSGDVPLAVQVITPNAAGQSWDWVEGTVVSGARHLQTVPLRAIQERTVL